MVFNNLTFINCIYSDVSINSPVVFNNVKFINCTAKDKVNFITSDGCYITVENCIFEMGDGGFYTIGGNFGLHISNSIFNGGNFDKGVISVNRAELLIENTTFANITSNMATAINYKGGNMRIINSKFINLHSLLTGGAIIGKYFPQNFEVIEKGV